MGRTVPSYRMTLEREINSWKPFRDALRIDERELFDDLMDLCRSRVSAASAAIRVNTVESILMTLVFMHHKIILELKKKMCDKSKLVST